MGWLSNFTRTWPTRAEWLPISREIDSGFGVAREDWFRICIQTLRSFEGAGKTSGPRGETGSNAQPDGPLPSVLTAWQLHPTPGFIEGRKYLPAPWVPDFCGVLWAQVGGADLPDIVARRNEFMEMADDTVRNLGLGRYVAERILGSDEAAFAHPAILNGLVHHFQRMNDAAVARAFGDRATLTRLEKRMDGWEERFYAHVENAGKDFERSGATV